MASVDSFLTLGHKITKHDMDGSISLGYQKFGAFFGTSPLVCVVVCDLLLVQRPRKSTPEHLLWALLLLKRYTIESVNAALVGVSEKNLSQVGSHLNSSFIKLASGNLIHLANLIVDFKIFCHFIHE